ncbi:MAG: helix-hairpin-helix domain-containing protein, partial [Candidatus Acidiferrales bacterium]
RHFGSLKTLRNATRTELEAVDGVGTKMAEQVITFFDAKRNRVMLAKLLDGKMQIVETEAAVAGAFKGLKFVLTGGAKAEELEGRAELLGKRLRVTGKLHPSHADRPPGLTVERWTLAAPTLDEKGAVP